MWPPLGLIGLDYLNCLGQEFPNEENKPKDIIDFDD